MTRGWIYKKRKIIWWYALHLQAYGQVWLLFRLKSPYDQCYNLIKLFYRDQWAPDITKQNIPKAIFPLGGTMKSTGTSEVLTSFKLLSQFFYWWAFTKHQAWITLKKCRDVEVTMKASMEAGGHIHKQKSTLSTISCSFIQKIPRTQLALSHEDASWTRWYLKRLLR